MIDMIMAANNSEYAIGLALHTHANKKFWEILENQQPDLAVRLKKDPFKYHEPAVVEVGAYILNIIID